MVGRWIERAASYTWPVLLWFLVADWGNLVTPLLLPPIQADAQHAPGLLLTAASVLLMWKTRIHVLWLLAVGAVLGLLGWV
jgi:hypothetical protein